MKTFFLSIIIMLSWILAGLLYEHFWPCREIATETVFAATSPCNANCRRYLKSLNLPKLPPGCVVGHVKPVKCGGSEEMKNLMLYCSEGPRRVAELKEKAECPK